jgi:hypothetical protein
MPPSLLTLPTLLAFASTTVSLRAPIQDGAPPPAAEPPISSMPHEALNEALRAIERDRGAVARVLAVGRSRSGREILGLRLAKGEPEAGRPAILVVADVDGSQGWTSSLALFEAQEIAAAAGGEYAALLESTTLLVIPCANPDAHQRAYETPATDREATGTGADDDRDGRAGEDGPSDVDGDGRITSLRVEDDTGEWTADDNDERVLVRVDAKKGQRGRWRLSAEGRDSDGDDEIAEDAPADARVNRNFPYGWEEHATDAGAFPLEEPEARALADFVLLHPEIALCVTYGSYDDLVEKPKTTRADANDHRVPAAGVIEADADVLAELGKRYGELTGNKAKSRGGDAGTFQGWMYAHRGVWSLAIQPWDIPLDAKDERSEEEKKQRGDLSDDVKRMKWIDAHPDEAWRFVPWKAAADVRGSDGKPRHAEVGGLAPFARTEPPHADSREIARKELKFLASLGADLARVEIASFVAKPLGSGLHQVDATVTNRSRLAVQNASAIRNEALRPLRIRLELSGDARIVAGRPIELQRELGGGGAHREYRWIVRASDAGDVRLVIDTDHAGRDEARAEVVR